jgi:hypothetical protein
MTVVPVERFEDAASERGSRGIVRSVGAFVKAHGVDAIGREQIARTLASVLDVATGHASPREEARIAVVADIMHDDVQLVLRLYQSGEPFTQDSEGPIGGFELWISFPRIS